MLVISGLDVRYGKSQVIFGINLTVGKGEVVALLGRNGSGKTTTMLGILGMLPGASGGVSLDGHDLGHMPGFRRVRAGLGYVPSGARCFPTLSVVENLRLSARSRNGLAGWSVDRVLQQFPQLQSLKNNLAGALSGGERQMLAVGRALVANPIMILMDEPTEGLAPVVVQSLELLIRELKQSGVGVLLAEQNHQMALKVADRAAFLEKGQLADVLPAGEARASEVLKRILGV